jgi:hypothetical protein
MPRVAARGEQAAQPSTMSALHFAFHRGSTLLINCALFAEYMY